ncbi:MAG: T9SS type A sorting domain-containing protein [Bacteroidales bacterium]|nr:T9SS type A sorting domain-containing protein [Bacteroidales bacterium]
MNKVQFSVLQPRQDGARLVKMLFSLSILILPFVSGAQTMRNEGAKLIIPEGSQMVITGNYISHSSAGTISLDGLLLVTGNLSSDAGSIFTSPDATGTLLLTGSASHSVTTPSGSTLVLDGLSITGTGSWPTSDGQKITVSGDLEVASGATFQLTSSSEAATSLITLGSADGEVTVQRYIGAWTDDDHGWHLLSSPVDGQTIAPGFTAEPSENYDFYLWSESNEVWVNFKNTTTSPTFLECNGSSGNFLSGRGYLVAYASTASKEFEGSLHDASIPVSGLTNTDGTQYAGWNLVGNPFPCYMQWNKTTGAGGWNLSYINGVAKIWDESAASYVDIAQSDPIPPLQGFMVQVSGSATGSLTLYEGDRVHEDDTWYKELAENVIKLRAVDPEGKKSQATVIRFLDGASASFEPEHDAHFLSGYAPLLYTVADGHLMSTNTLPTLDETLRIPLYFRKNEHSLFSIEADSAISLIPAYPVYLTDRKLGITTNLTRGKVYTFSSEEGDDPYRFEIHFKAVGVGESQPTASVQIWSDGQSLYIRNPQSLTGTIEVVSMTGQRILGVPLTNEVLQQQHLHVTSGVYYVRVYGQQVFGSRKVFLN